MREQEKLLEDRKNPEKRDNQWEEVMKYVDENRQGTKDTTRMMSVIAGRKDDKV